MILSRQQRICLVELPDVVAAVVRRQRNPAQHHLGPESMRVDTMRSRFSRVLAMGNPRNPSLPPNATITTTGFSRNASWSRSTPSLVVLPPIP